MKQYPPFALLAMLATALVVVAGAGVSAHRSDAATLAPGSGSVTVTLRRSSVVCLSRTPTRGRTTFVVRNARAGVTSFVLARHAGGLLTLPRIEGMAYLPAEEVVARLHRIPVGRQRRIAATLAPGEYLLVATIDASGPIFVAAAVTIRAR
jgi:hypothetical protein